MTEKRYKLSEPNGAYLIDNDRPYAHWINDDDKIIDLLNEQHEQINTLRESRRELISANNEYRMRETELAQELSTLVDDNEQLKASLYAEKTNTAEVINEYAKQFKRYSSQFSFMIDLAEDLGIDVSKLEALDD